MDHFPRLQVFFNIYLTSLKFSYITLYKNNFLTIIINKHEKNEQENIILN